MRLVSRKEKFIYRGLNFPQDVPVELPKSHSKDIDIKTMKAWGLEEVDKDGNVVPKKAKPKRIRNRGKKAQEQEPETDQDEDNPDPEE